MKVTTYRGKKLTRDHIAMPDMVLQYTGEDEYTLRRKPIYPKGFSAMANALWKRESLDFRKKWKHLLAGGDPRRQPIWEITIEIYRAVLYLRLLNNEYLHAAAPRRLPAIQFDCFYGLPACNYATLSKPYKRELRDRIAHRRAELKQQAEAKRIARQAPAQPVKPARALLSYFYHIKPHATSTHRSKAQWAGIPLGNPQIVIPHWKMTGGDFIPP